MTFDAMKGRKPSPQLRTLAQTGACRDLSDRRQGPRDHEKPRPTENSEAAASNRASASEGRSDAGSRLASCVLEEAGQAVGMLTAGRQGYSFHAVFPALSALEGQTFRTIPAAERAVKAALQELRQRNKAYCPRCGYLRAPADMPLR